MAGRKTFFAATSQRNPLSPSINETGAARRTGCRNGLQHPTDAWPEAALSLRRKPRGACSPLQIPANVQV
jgi:hypothetical protein